MNRVDKTLQFIKEAFCVDGEVTLEVTPTTYDHRIVCNDSKRGRFYVSFDTPEGIGEDKQ